MSALHVPTCRSGWAALAVSADTALRLARYFGTSEPFGLNLQAQYDLDGEYDRIGERIEREIMPRAV